jgi:hypothetical protein
MSGTQGFCKRVVPLSNLAAAPRFLRFAAAGIWAVVESFGKRIGECRIHWERGRLDGNEWTDALRTPFEYGVVKKNGFDPFG